MPGIKLAESAPVKIQALAASEWYDFYTSPTPLPPGDYWLVIHTDGTSAGSTPGIVRDIGHGDINNSITNWYGAPDAFSDGASSPFGTGVRGNVELVVEGSYLPPQQARFAGRATVAGSPSGGLSANYKRGSRFTLSEPGRVFELAAYLDGKGGGSGSQKLRYALYNDAAGTPGTRILESDEVTVVAGQAGRWVSAHVLPTDIPAGNYWIVIHTGDTGGVARNFGDGAANWFANADLYSDGATASFGAGASGTVTLSAVAMYVPGPVETGTLGRTTVAATPSGGLSTNFMRGSGFGGVQLTDSGVVTAFWAYLDGNGGGSGSQPVRAVLYGDPQTRAIPLFRVYESETVNIPAGMSPRWVRFPLKAPVQLRQNPKYWIMLQSGDPAGIARDYGDGQANWLGIPDTFSDGSALSFVAGEPPSTMGTVTLSIYAEYAEPHVSPR